MAAPTTLDVAGSSYIGGSIREDLASFITMLSPEKTPFSSTIGSNKATSVRHDWETDTLFAPADNAQAENFTFAADNAQTDVPVRISNYTQVFGKTIDVPGSLNRSDFVLPQNYFSYQRIKRGKEILRDIERRALLQADNATPIQSAPGQPGYTKDQGNNVNRHFGGVASFARNWVNADTTNPMYVFNGTTQAGSEGINAAGGARNLSQFATAQVGDGTVTLLGDQSKTLGNLTTKMVNDLAALFSANNGMMSVAQVPTSLKSGVSETLIAGNGGAAQRRASELAKKVNMAVDAVITEFGFDVSIVPNYIMETCGVSADAGTPTTLVSGSTNSIFFYDPKAVKKSVLAPMDTVKDLQARYGEAYILFTELTLEATDPNSMGYIANVTNPAAS